MPDLAAKSFTAFMLPVKTLRGIFPAM